MASLMKSSWVIIPTTLGFFVCKLVLLLSNKHLSYSILSKSMHDTFAKIVFMLMMSGFND